MAMSIATLKAGIEAQLIAEFGTADDPAKMAKFANAIATAVYTEITTNAVIPGAGLTDSVGGSINGQAQVT